MSEREPTTRLPRVPPLLLAQVRFQIGLLLRTPRSLGMGLALPVLLLLLSDTQRGHPSTGHVAGLATLGASMTAWTTHGIGLVAAREAGVLKRWRATPLPPWCYFAARVLATVILATMAGAITIAAGLFLFGTGMHAGDMLAAIGVLSLGAAACAAASTAAAGLVPNVASAFPVLGLTYLPVVFVSGTVGPTAVPGWLTTLMGYLPIRPTVLASGNALGAGGIDPVNLAVLAAWAVGGILAALVTFRWEPSRPKQKRTAQGPASHRQDRTTVPTGSVPR